MTQYPVMYKTNRYIGKQHASSFSCIQQKDVSRAMIPLQRTDRLTKYNILTAVSNINTASYLPVKVSTTIVFWSTDVELRIPYAPRLMARTAPAERKQAEGLRESFQ